MPDGVKISELDQVTSLNVNDIFPVCQPHAQSDTGYLTKRATVSDMAHELFGEINYTSELQTTVKTAWGAINELKEDVDSADKKLADHALINLDDCTFATFVTSTEITFTIPLTNGVEDVNDVEIYSLANESFTIPSILTQDSLSTLGTVTLTLKSGIGVVVTITNLNTTPAVTGASVAHCEEATLYFTYTEPES